MAKITFSPFSRSSLGFEDGSGIGKLLPSDPAQCFLADAEIGGDEAQGKLFGKYRRLFDHAIVFFVGAEPQAALESSLKRHASILVVNPDKSFVSRYLGKK